MSCCRSVVSPFNWYSMRSAMPSASASSFSCTARSLRRAEFCNSATRRNVTIVVAVLMSLAVARLITPMVAAYFLKAKGRAKHGEGWLMDRYMGLLHWSLVHRWKTMLIGVAAFMTWYLAGGAR